MDYAAWADRASHFLRGLTHLPGEIVVSDEIKPPGADSWTQEWLRSERCSLPPELREFVASGSRHCSIYYRWKPPRRLRGALGEVLKDRIEVEGGAGLCNSSEFSNFDRRSPTHVIDEQRAKWAALGLTEDLLEFALDTGGASDVERSHGRISLHELGNGDRLSLVCDAAHPSRPVVYVTKGQSEAVRKISPSFDQFLSDWEHVCYLTPTPDNFERYWKPEHGFLRPDSEMGRRLRGLLSSSHAE